jgi:ABC-2 type transport system permease protein
MSISPANVLTVAGRELTVRIHTRSFLVSTLVLVVAGVALALAPVIIGYFDRNTNQRIGIYVASSVRTGADPVATVDALLNATAGSSPAGGSSAESRDFVVTAAADVDAGRRDVMSGKLSALLAVDRTSSGDLGFTLYSSDPPFSRTPQLIQQAATSIAVSDRLSRAGVAPAQQAGLFAPAPFSVEKADPTKSGTGGTAASGGSSGAATFAQDIANTAVGSVLAIFIFLAIILYGTWVAMSVVEEKQSRVMEVILGAASPAELLSGKVIGVGAVAIVQYVLILLPMVATLLLQGPIASAVLGQASSSIQLPSGLTAGTLAWFSVFFVLGFGLYAVLFAAAGSLVSRQEDVNQVIMPMTLLSSVGYFVSVYAATGLFDLDAPWLVGLSHIPFLSPYLMIVRIMAGKVAPFEPFVAVVVLLLTMALCIWIAARVYAAGVLMYGQKPGIRPLVRALRTSR